MNKKLLILSFLISTITYSQVQKIFYVDDVKTIEVKIIGLLGDSYIYLADFLERPTVIGEIKKIK